MQYLSTQVHHWNLGKMLMDAFRLIHQSNDARPAKALCVKGRHVLYLPEPYPTTGAGLLHFRFFCLLLQFSLKLQNWSHVVSITCFIKFKIFLLSSFPSLPCVHYRHCSKYPSEKVIIFCFKLIVFSQFLSDIYHAGKQAFSASML